MRHRSRWGIVGAVLVVCSFAVATLMTGTVAAKKPGGGQFCGGIAGIPCPEGFTCVDDPRDDCNPKTGGADCGGICVR